MVNTNFIVQILTLWTIWTWHDWLSYKLLSSGHFMWHPVHQPYLRFTNVFNTNHWGWYKISWLINNLNFMCNIQISHMKHQLWTWYTELMLVITRDDLIINHITQQGSFINWKQKSITLSLMIFTCQIYMILDFHTKRSFAGMRQKRPVLSQLPSC